MKLHEIPTREEYEASEARLLLKQLAGVEQAPPSERKEAGDAMRRAMADDPDIVGDRVGLLLNGSYGWGACRRAVNILAQSKRSNKAAALVHLVGALEWQCPPRSTAAAWNTLTAKQKRALDRAVREAMLTEPAVSG